jgi:CRISPR-associated protein Cas5d
MTPSAARGILEAIHWKPAIRWLIEQIDVLNPIRWESVRRNEVGSVMSPVSGGLFIEEQRQQRAGLFLRDVDYVIHAHFEMTDRVGPDDKMIKHAEMFQRRAEKGQCFHRPYLGCREFAAQFILLAPDQQNPEPAEKTRDMGFGQPRDLGYMLHDMLHDNSQDKGQAHFCTKNCRAYFFPAKLENGTLKVPPLVATEMHS